VAFQTGHLEFECRIVRADQVERWISARGEAFRDEQGKPIRMAGVLTDITERKRMESALRTSEEGLRLLVEGVKDYAIFMLDPGGRVASWNAGAERIKGYHAEEIMGQHFSRFYTAEDIAQGKPDAELKAAASQGHAEAEGWRVRKDGSRFWANVVIAPVHSGGGELLGFSKVTRDFTERKRIEEEIHKLNAELQARVVELAASNRELEAFSYSVSHDLRAPLRQIDGFSRILLDEISESLSDEQREYLDLIRNGTRHMGKLVDTLLNFSRLGRQELNRQPVALDVLVGDIISELDREAGTRTIQWLVGPLPIVDGDAALLRQAWMNLLANAVKFTRTREQAVIEVGAREAPAPDLPPSVSPGQAVFFVRDNGVGFDVKYADKLFGVFQRLHLQDEFEGTGVGLATVQRIVLKHGGSIWAQAAPGVGAAFFFTLTPGEGLRVAGRSA
jgi:PAS domain S-box-containing protein